MEIYDDVTNIRDLKWNFKSNPDSLISDSGLVDTSSFGNYSVDVKISDEAGNTTTKSITLDIGVIEISSSSINTTVYYGPLGEIILEKATARDTTLDNEPVQELKLDFRLTNNSSLPSVVALKDTYIDDMKVGCYYTVGDIDPGRTGTVTSTIYVKKSMDQNWTEIEGELIILSSDGYYYFSAPVIINRNVFS